ncbi:phosphotransferase [Nonomuraea sp. NN258]|uniref:phosphotransferase n=1 Tax=Nonomuraea antri TaxID=2730852 RepID=UPI00156861E2|nr:phosphotransferase [Nonomuraea antri]NRQ33224.1 phosphotransferase [Nonomuraea antri]
MTQESSPPAGGVRVPWQEVHPAVRERVAEFLGSAVTEAVTQTGGFSPAAAVRLRTADGRRAFVKSVGPEPNPESAPIYRSEAKIAAALPASAPAPRLLTSFEVEGWVTLVFEDVEGDHPELPWRREQLDLVMRALDRMAAALTPSPVDAPTIGETFDGAFRGWRNLLGEDTAGLDPWALRHLGELAELESGWAKAAAGDTLVHADLRADNLLLRDGHVYVVDWPWASLGAAWFDRVAMLPSVRMQGGPPPHELLPDPDPAITAVVAAVTGYLVRQARQPDPPGLPTLRAFQRAQGVVALEWLRQRTGWA